MPSRSTIHNPGRRFPWRPGERWQGGLRATVLLAAILQVCGVVAQAQPALQVVEIDVTRQVEQASQSDGLLSIAIKSPHNVGAEGRSVYHSVEAPGALSCKLVIRYDEAKEYVLVGQSIQKALDAIHAKGGGQVILSRGKHRITGSLTMYSDITLRGVRRRIPNDDHWMQHQREWSEGGAVGDPRGKCQGFHHSGLHR